MDMNEIENRRQNIEQHKSLLDSAAELPGFIVEPLCNVAWGMIQVSVKAIVHLLEAMIHAIRDIDIN